MEKILNRKEIRKKEIYNRRKYLENTIELVENFPRKKLKSKS